jgi:phosphonate transport system substrate-binding protein
MLRRSFLCLSFLVALSGVQAQAPLPAYTVAIVPQFGAEQLRNEWQPLLDRVGKAANVRLEMKHYASIPAFETGFLKGEADFIFANPYHAVLARAAQGYLPLVRDSELLTGLLVVPTKGGATTLKELDGKAIAFPAPNAFGASLYMRALLIQEAKIQFEPRYVRTHSNVYRQTALGDVAAGGGVNQTFNDLPLELRAQLRVLYETPGAAPHPFAAHPRVPADLRQRVTTAFLDLARDDAGRAMLKSVRMPHPVAASYATDYAPLERLQLERYLVLER